MQTQGITNAIESDAMGQLCVEQGDHMTPWSKGPDLLIDFGFARYLGNQELRNEVANLPQQIQFRTGWNAIVVFSHPCRVAGPSKTFQPFLEILWDGCDDFKGFELLSVSLKIPPGF
jgi:hypothetical protein